MTDSNRTIVKMKDLVFSPKLFINYQTGTILDELLCSYKGLPKGVNYMVIGDPGVGKTTIILDMLSNIHANYPATKILFVSAEMNEIDVAIYAQRYPKFQDLDILFLEMSFDEDNKCWDRFKQVLNRGWDIVAIDSFYELQGIIKEEEEITLKKAESMLISLVKQHNKADNARKVNTTFLTIQQVTKTGAFVGSNRLKHMITAMMELRFENAKNIYSQRFIVFSKHRRGEVGIKLYYDLSTTGNIHFDVESYQKDMRIKQAQSQISEKIRAFAHQFDNLFNQDDI